jgi:hypothetical protein
VNICEKNSSLNRGQLQGLSAKWACQSVGKEPNGKFQLNGRVSMLLGWQRAKREGSAKWACQYVARLAKSQLGRFS